MSITSEPICVQHANRRAVLFRLSSTYSEATSTGFRVKATIQTIRTDHLDTSDDDDLDAILSEHYEEDKDDGDGQPRLVVIVVMSESS